MECKNGIKSGRTYSKTYLSYSDKNIELSEIVRSIHDLFNPLNLSHINNEDLRLSERWTRIYS